MTNLDRTELAKRILDALPQTQCTRCGYPDCAAYAEAISLSTTDINQCPPGGAEGVQRLANIIGQPATKLNPTHGAEGPRAVAVIDEAWCIGCTLCLPACPTDAIIGSNKMMHTVIEAHCTGCELCLAVCPVDCISMENVSGDKTGWGAWSATAAINARDRYDLHQQRLNSVDPPSLSATKTAAENTAEIEDLAHQNDSLRKQALIQAALLRSRKKAYKQPLGQ